MAKLISGTRIYGTATIDSNVTIGSVGAISGQFHTFVGNITQSASGGAVYINTTGNVLAVNFVGSGALLTALPGYAYSNVNVKAYTESMGFQNYGNVNVAALITTNGLTNYSNVNVIAYLAGGVTSTGFINTSGNVSAAIHTGGAVSVTGFINTSGNVSAATVIAGTMTTTGTITAAVVNSTGNILATGGVFNSLTVNGNQSITGFVNVTGNIIAAVAEVGAIESSGIIYANSTTAAISTTTGALIVAGGVGISRDVHIGGNLTVDGNVFINGNTVTINANNLSLNDGMIFLADGNPADTIDLGFIGHYTNPTLLHAGFVRDATDGVWKLFSNVSANPTTTVDFTNAIYNNLLIGNLLASQITISGLSSAGFINTSGNVSAAVHLGGQVAVSGLINTAGNVVASQGSFGSINSTGLINTSGNILAAAGVFNSLTVNGGITSTGLINTSGNILAQTANVGQIGVVTSLVVGQSAFVGELFVRSVGGDEGGQINLGPAVTNTTLVGNVTIDVYQNKLRIWEGGGTNRGGYFDISGLAASVGTNLAAGGGGGTPGGGNQQLQFNSGGTFAGAASLYYFGANGAIVANAGIASTSTTTGTMQITGGIGVTGNVTADIFNSVNNGSGTNFKVGDDVWLGDINIANTLGIKGQQDGTQGYIRFGNVNTNALGVNGSGPLSWGGNLAIGTVGTASGQFHTVIGNITQSTSGGAVYFNTTGNVMAAIGQFGSINSTGLINTTGNVSAATVIAGQFNTTGNVLATGAVFNSLTVNGGITSTGFFNTTSNISAAVVNAGALNATGTTTLVAVNSTGFINTTGNVSAAVVNAGALNATGTTTLVAVNSTGFINTTGNVSAAVHTGGAVSVTGFINTTGNVSGAVVNAGALNVSGTTTVAGITSTGFINTSGNVSAAVVNGGAINSTGLINTTGNVSASQGSFGSIVSTGVINTAGNVLATSAIFNYLDVNGNIDVGSIATPGAGHTIVGNITQSGAGAVRFNTSGNILAAAGTFSSATVNGIVSASNVTVAGNVTGTFFIGNGALLTGIVSGGGGGFVYTVSVSPPVTSNAGDVWYDSGTDTLFQRINDGTNTVWVDVAGLPLNINTVVQGTSLSITGNGTVTGNLTVGNRLVGTAVQALYADLAEVYLSDQEYDPGVVLVFGGSAEVTRSVNSHNPSIAGVVSTNPAYLMNSGIKGVSVALTGRVPCWVKGPINKGDRVVSGDLPGVGEKLNLDKYQPGCIIGKSLESIEDEEIKKIEVVVGRV